MDVFKLRDAVVDEYRSYVESFVRVLSRRDLVLSPEPVSRMMLSPSRCRGIPRNRDRVGIEETARVRERLPARGLANNIATGTATRTDQAVAWCTLC